MDDLLVQAFEKAPEVRTVPSWETVAPEPGMNTGTQADLPGRAEFRASQPVQQTLPNVPIAAGQGIKQGQTATLGKLATGAAGSAQSRAEAEQMAAPHMQMTDENASRLASLNAP